MGSIPGLAEWVKDPALLWLWCEPAAAGPSPPVAGGLPNATGVALKGKKMGRGGFFLQTRNSGHLKWVQIAGYTSLRHHLFVYVVFLRIFICCFFN